MRADRSVWVSLCYIAIGLGKQGHVVSGAVIGISHVSVDHLDVTAWEERIAELAAAEAKSLAFNMNWATV
jgi:hypothetical protein